MKEIWKKIKYSDEYEVSNMGRFRHLYINRYDINTKKIKKIQHITYINPQTDGEYLVVRIYNGRENYKILKVHRLIAETFLDKTNFKYINEDDRLKYINNLDKLCVNHKDENKANNNVNNLEWCTHKYNIRYSKAKKVKQYDLEGNFIKQWDSIKDASLNLKINSSNICCCCKGIYKTCGNYIWRYVEIEKVE